MQASKTNKKGELSAFKRLPNGVLYGKAKVREKNERVVWLEQLLPTEERRKVMHEKQDRLTLTQAWIRTKMPLGTCMHKRTFNNTNNTEKMQEE